MHRRTVPSTACWATLATNAAGKVLVGPERPIRGYGAFVNLGLPLSRWFNANPKSHNAGVSSTRMWVKTGGASRPD